MELKGSKTEQNLNDAFSRNSVANLRYLYFAAKASWKGITMSLPCSGLVPMARLGMDMVTWSTWRPWAIP
jgi:hypothetical protein